MDTSTPPAQEETAQTEAIAARKEQLPSATVTPPQLPSQTEPTATPEKPHGKGSKKVFAGVGVGLIVILLLAGLVYLFVAPASQTARIRDIFIILMAFMSLMIGLTLVILIVQVAELTNLLKNEIKPILDSTNETVSTLRGTTAFLSENLVGPVIKLNEYLAVFKRLFELLSLGRKQKS
jgi:hypothetical protein